MQGKEGKGFFTSKMSRLVKRRFKLRLFGEGRGIPAGRKETGFLPEGATGGEKKAHSPKIQEDKEISPKKLWLKVEKREELGRRSR